MRQLFILLCFFSVSYLSYAQSYTLKTVPHPKVNGNFYVSNPDQILSVQEEALLNIKMDSLEKQTSNQVAIVVLNSIGEEVPKDFATALFNQWGVGIKGKENGLLLLLVKDQRRVEMETGYGMEAILTDGTCKIIQEREMIPSFKKGNYGTGIIKGMDVVASILRQPENKALVESYIAVKDKPSAEEISFAVFRFCLIHMIVILIIFLVKLSRKDFLHLYPKASQARKDRMEYLPISLLRWVMMYVLLPLVFYFALSELNFDNFLFAYVGATYGYLLLVLAERKLRRSKQALALEGDHEKYYKLERLNKGVIWAAIIFPAFFLFYYFWYKSKSNVIRNHSRNCPKCSKELQKLDEYKDDAYLEKNQLKEENLRSVDYDVWVCRSCQYHVVLAFKNVRTNYTECIHCKTVAMRFKTSKTISSATYSSSGEGERIYQCENCQKQKVELYSIPMLVESSSSDSSSSGSSSGSYGGGSSGGGGAGSSW